MVQSKQIFSSPIPYAKGMLSVLTMARARRYDHLGVTCNILGAGLRDLKEHGMYSCAKKKLIFLVGLLFQNCLTGLIKANTKKMRPCGSDTRSFPSGHASKSGFAWMMSVKEHGVFSLPSLTSSILMVATCAERYLRGKHDVVDLSCGFAIGATVSFLTHKVAQKV